MTAVTFFGWWQPPGAAAVSSGALNAGRLSAALQLTASDLDRPSDSATRTLVYDLLGPGDVTGLVPAAVVHTYPSPGARNVEIDKAVYAELAAADLPWRHTRDPYSILVSEIMLQQTQVQRAMLYYEKFLRRYPTVEDLARACVAGEDLPARRAADPAY